MRNVVDLATSEPPPLRYTVDDIVEAGQRQQRRRQVGWVSSGAAAVAVLGVTAVVAAGSLAGTPSKGSAAGAVSATSSTSVAAADAAQSLPVPAPAFTFTFDAYRVGKLRVAKPIDVSTAFQMAPIYADDLAPADKAVDSTTATGSGPKGGGAASAPRMSAYLTVYQPNAYDASKLVHPVQISVGGRPGVWTTQGTGPGVPRNILAWQYGMNAWAVITEWSDVPGNPSQADLVALAAGLRPAAPAVARVPFTMTYVPAGYKLDEVAMHAMADLNGIAGAEDGDYAGALFSRPALPTTGLTGAFEDADGNDPPGSFQIFVVPTSNANQKPSSGVSCMNGFCNKWADNGTVNIQVDSGGRLSNSEMTKILNGITLGNVHDDTTWTPVGTAIR